MTGTPDPAGTGDSSPALTSQEPSPAAEPTVGTGTIVAIGCLALLLVAFAIVAVTRFMPHLGG
ncbi:MAG: hypothetical protein ACKOWF_04510 [Chloroflexota bacterium]